MKIKENFPLILGLSIPLLMVLFVAGSIYLPGFMKNPEYDFLYSTSDYGPNHYSVQDQKLVKIRKSTTTATTKVEPRLFIHDVDQNKSEEISFEQAQQLALDPSSESPNGFKVKCGSESGGLFPFFVYSNRDCSKRFLVGHNNSRKLNLKLQGQNYYNFHFLGWIKNE